MNVTLPRLAGPAADVWPVLFELARDRPTGWIVVGSQMVILHAAAHGIQRPLATEDADVVVDVRELATTNIAHWLEDHGFELGNISPDGIGHRFRRSGLVIDVLAIDHAHQSDRTTIPPARTVEVPGGRRAIGRTTTVTVTSLEHGTGTVPVPDWLGAVLLKARASVAITGDRPKHVQDLALLLGLPEDVHAWAGQLAGKDRTHLRAATRLIDDRTWEALATVIHVPTARAAIELLT